MVNNEGCQVTSLCGITPQSVLAGACLLLNTLFRYVLCFMFIFLGELSLYIPPAAPTSLCIRCFDRSIGGRCRRVRKQLCAQNLTKRQRLQTPRAKAEAAAERHLRHLRHQDCEETSGHMVFTNPLCLRSVAAAPGTTAAPHLYHSTRKRSAAAGLERASAVARATASSGWQ